MNNKNKIISEYGYIYTKKPYNLNSKFIHTEVSKKQFDELYDYWKEDDNAKKVLAFDGHSLKAQNYVGIIQTDSLSIEILPKIFEDINDEVETRNIFIQMLKVLLNVNEIQINRADLSTTTNKNIYEMFIAMFIEHLDKLIHRGLKSEYISKEDNQFFLKGKLKFNQHIKQNYIHKERFYVEFDEYLQDKIENRLLKSTVELLLKKTKDYENKKALRQQLFIFDEVRLSSNYDLDISKINLYRGMEYYEMPLRFAKVFLKHQSFTSLRGKDNVFALLFPMEKVFENYMEFVLNNSKDKLGIDRVLVNAGKNEYLLTNDKCKMARLQPDYLLKMKDDVQDIVTDAKWKLLEVKEDQNKGCDTVNISSSDVYQIFSYLHFYDAQDTAYLFVPKIGQLKSICFDYNLKEQNKKIKVIPIDIKQTIKDNHSLKNRYFA